MAKKDLYEMHKNEMGIYIFLTKRTFFEIDFKKTIDKVVEMA